MAVEEGSIIYVVAFMYIIVMVVEPEFLVQFNKVLMGEESLLAIDISQSKFIR